MTIKDLYKKNIDRDLNPAVSADDNKPTTIEAEISEYVFTDEVINGLYNVLSEIMLHNVSHNGIWINGFFGSGKSHFLKFLQYCISPQYSEQALARYAEAIKERDPLQNPNSKSEVSIADFNRLAAWIKKASVDIVLFNIGAFHDTNNEDRSSFTHIFWNQFNKLRGYNYENLSAAQHLEKNLDVNGKFDEFKQRLLDEYGFDWQEQSSMLLVGFLDTVLEVAHDLLPTLSVDSVKKAIMDDQHNVSPDAFCRELKEHIDKKDNSNYRILFLVDEVSQFVNNNKTLLLQLQEIVTGLNNVCGNKAWLACTAQQDLSQLMSNIDIHETSDDYGRIMGRFEVRVSLTGRDTEFITQKRLLDKNENGAITLRALYNRQKLSIDNQFATLPDSFNSFEDENDFVNFYPFVPYQFHLMTLVLNAFSSLGYIDVQARGNERSVIKITHSTAKANMNANVGTFVPFDCFYNSMFQGSLKKSGQDAIRNAEAMIEKYSDLAFARRVVNILFMICNLPESEKLLFPATLDYIVTLLMEDVDANRQALMQRVENVLAFLKEKHIIRTDKYPNSNIVIYCFQSEDEINAEREIEAITPDNAAMARQYYDIFSKHLKAFDNKEKYCSRFFSIGWDIYRRNFLASNADVIVEFAMNTFVPGSADSRCLIFNVARELDKDMQLKNDFYYYCQVQDFATRPKASAVRERTVAAINERVKTLYDNVIVPKLAAILDRCELYSGGMPINNVTVTGANRYKEALKQHLKNVFPYAEYVNGSSIPEKQQELPRLIMRPVQPGEYGPMSPITDAENEVEKYLNQQPGVVYVKQVLDTFKARPYGWSEVATCYILNELRRRQKRTLIYKNDPNVDTQIIANNLYSNANSFTIAPASEISADLVNNFIAAWKHVFNTSTVPNTHDANELFRACKEAKQGENHINLASTINNYEDNRGKIATLPFAHALDEVIELLRKWKGERDAKKFFEMVIADQTSAVELIDKGKKVISFVRERLEAYNKIFNYAKESEQYFSYLDEPELAKAQELLGIVTDAYPLDNMRKYAEAQRAISTALDKVRADKREQIKYRYTQEFEYLKSVCAENGVPYGIDEETVVWSVTQSSNIHVLDKALDTSDFHDKEVKKIFERKPKPQPKPQPGGGTPAPQPKKTHFMALSTRTTKPLKTEADVDAYLAKLKQQLMTVINGDEEIMVK